MIEAMRFILVGLRSNSCANIMRDVDVAFVCVIMSNDFIMKEVSMLS